MPTKWFFPLQKIVSKVLSEKYLEHRCNYQDITKDHVHENFICFYKGKEGASVFMQSCQS